MHGTEKLPESYELCSLRDEIIADENYHKLVGEVEGKMVSNVTLAVTKILTREIKPYALIENVVTTRITGAVDMHGPLCIGLSTW